MSEKTTFTARNGAESGALGEDIGPTSASKGATQGEQADPDLEAVVKAWDSLPEAIRAGILAMVKAAGGTP